MEGILKGDYPFTFRNKFILLLITSLQLFSTRTSGTMELTRSQEISVSQSDPNSTKLNKTFSIICNAIILMEEL